MTAFLNTSVNIKRLLPEFIVAFVKDLEEDEDSAGTLNSMLGFLFFSRNKCVV